MSTRFDPSIEHYWETSQSGEWPMVEARPACTPTEVRRIHRTDLPTKSDATPDTPRCKPCEEVAALMEGA